MDEPTQLNILATRTVQILDFEGYNLIQAESVAASFLEFCKRLKGIISEQEISNLERLANLALDDRKRQEALARTTPPSAKSKHSHPLDKNQFKNYPVYCTMAFYHAKTVEYDLAKRATNTLQIIQLLVMLGFAKANRQQILDIASLANSFVKDSAPFLKLFNETISDWLDERLSRIKSGNPDKLPLPNAKEIHRHVITKRWATSLLAILDTIEPPRPLGPHDLINDEDLEDDEENSKARTKFIKSPHYIRGDRTLGGRGKEALSNLESNLVHRDLDDRLRFESEPARQLATLAWWLCQNSGRAFDALGSALLNRADEVGGTLYAITFEDGYIRLHCHHPNKARLENPNSEVEGKPARLAFSICLQLPEGVDADLFGEIVRSQKVTEKDLLLAKDDIRKEIRQRVTPRFTETRLRGAFVQRLLLDQHFDIPVVQLICDERLDQGLSAQHYIAWRERDLQKAVDQTLYSLFLHKQNLPESCYQNYWVGAAKATLSPKELKPLVDWHNAKIETYQSLRTKGHGTERLAILSELARFFLPVGCGHRNNADIERITLSDFCMSAGLVLFRDKRTNPKHYRRLAVVPSIGITYLGLYIDYLRHVVENSNHPSINNDFRAKASRALSGEGRLFFAFSSGRPFVKTSKLFDEKFSGIERNQFRSLHSLLLRELGAYPLLIETHLGHYQSGQVIGDFGLISPIEFASTLRPKIDKLLEDIGFTVDEPTLTNRKIKHQRYGFITAKQLAKLDASERQRDWELFLRQREKYLSVEIDETHVQDQKLEPSGEDSTPSKVGLIDRALTYVVPDYNPKSSEARTLSQNDCRRLFDFLTADSEKNLFRLASAKRKLDQKLEWLHDAFGWEIDTPDKHEWDIQTPIFMSPSNLRAEDCRQWLILELAKYVDKSDPIDLYQAAECALLLHGSCTSFEESREWLSAITAGNYSENGQQLILDLEDGSRTLSGNVLTFVESWRSAGCPKPGSTAETPFPAFVQQKDIEAVAKHSLYIRFPKVLADVISGVTPCRALDRRRLLDLLNNGARVPTAIASVTPETDEDSVEKKSTRRSSTEDFLFDGLIKFVQPPVEGAPLEEKMERKKRRNAVKNWRQDEDIHWTLRMMQRFALKLLGDHANLKSGKTLAYSTIKDYLSTAYDIVSIVCDDTALENWKRELANQYDSVIKQFVVACEGNENRVQVANRLFSELSGDYPLPDVQLRVSTRSKPSAPPRIITDAEVAQALDIIAELTQHSGISINQFNRLLALDTALRLFASTGARKKEIKHLRQRDYLCGTGVENSLSVLLIRYRKVRPLKTASSSRYIELANSVVPQINKNDDLLLLANLENNDLEALLSSILKIATGDRRACIHDLRHTVASKYFLDAFQSNDLFERVFKLEKLVAELGHARVTTTLEYYAHTVHHAISLFSTRQEALITHSLASKLLNEQQDTIRQRASRSFVHVLYKPEVTAASTRPEEFKGRGKKKKISDLIQPLLTYLGVSTAEKYNDQRFENVLSFIHELAIGSSVGDAAARSSINKDRSLQLIDHIIASQQKLKWSAISEARLNSIVLSIDKKIPDKAVTYHKRFPIERFDAFREKLDQVRLQPEQISLFQSALDISHERHIRVRSGLVSLAKVDQALEVVGISGKLSQKGKITCLETLEGIFDKHGRNILKLFLLALSVYSTTTQLERKNLLAA